MRSYISLFTLSFLTVLLITPLVRRWAIGWGAVAIPDNGRHIHARPTPRLGGVAIYFAFVVPLLCVPLLGNMVSDTFRLNLPKLLALLAPATIVFLFGIYDDFRNVSAPFKLTFQTFAAVLVFVAGFRIENLSLPFGQMWHLPVLLSFLLTVLWIVVLTNAFNLLDGIDGLAAGASVFALLSILVFSIAQANPEISLLAVVLLGAVMGFLRYNFNPATIFLGDSGSLFLGFMSAVLSLAGSQKGSTIVAIAIPLVSFGLPVTETGLSLVRRFLGGQSLLAGDRGHIHHMLLQRGLTQRQAAILLYGVCALFSLFGLMLLNPARNLAALVFFVVGVGVIFGVQRLRYAEFSELGSQIKQGVTRHRRALAVNVRVRRTSDDLGQVKDLEQLFAALDAMLETNEFDCVVLEINREWLIQADSAMRQEDRWMRVWNRSKTSYNEIRDSDRFWSLRVPLTGEQHSTLGAITFYRSFSDGLPAIDLRHLCGAFQQELSTTLLRLTRQVTAASE